jgi:hypothetical protein
MDKFLDDILDEMNTVSDEATMAIIARLRKFIANNSGAFNIPKPNPATPEALREYNRRQTTAMATVWAELEVEINTALAGSNYPSAIQGLIRKASEIESIASKTLLQYKWPARIATRLDVLGIGAEREAFRETLVQSLRASFSDEVLQPIRQAVAYNIRAGASTKQTIQFLDGLLKKKPGQEYAKMARYTTQIVTDAVLGYEGAIYQRFADEYGTTEWGYVGSLIGDSRPFCGHVVNNLKGKIPAKDLDKLLVKFLSDKNLSRGMRPGTNSKNFSQNRGGYRCRHRTFPIYRPAKDE